MEYATSDDRGFVYVAGVEKSDLLKIDARTNAVVRPLAHARLRPPAWPRFGQGRAAPVHGLRQQPDDGGGRRQRPCRRRTAHRPGQRRPSLTTRSASGCSVPTAWMERSRSSSRRRPTPTGLWRPSRPRLAAAPWPSIPASGRLYIVAADTDQSQAPGGRAARADPAQPMS